MINLEKGQRINLEKTNGSKLMNFCVGCNWGAITHIENKEVVVNKGFLGLFSKKEIKPINVTKDVDLDLSCVMMNSEGELCDYIYSPLYKSGFLSKYNLSQGKLDSRDNALHHSGDDRQGDVGGDDGLDNEIITVDLSRINSDISQIIFFLNVFGIEDFSKIPYAAIRMYEGTPNKVNEVFAQYDIATDSKYSGMYAVIMGKLYKKNSEWKFAAIGDAFEDSNIGITINRIIKNYSRK